MQDTLKTKSSDKDYPTRVVADFGGRRKVFDRRMQPTTIAHPERRSGRDRRSGFDRRGALNQPEQDVEEKRANAPSADPK